MLSAALERNTENMNTISLLVKGFDEVSGMAAEGRKPSEIVRRTTAILRSVPGLLVLNTDREAFAEMQRRRLADPEHDWEVLELKRGGWLVSCDGQLVRR